MGNKYVYIAAIAYILLFSTPVSAETGSLFISSGSSNSYTVGIAFSSFDYNGFTKIEFFSSGYNHVTSITYTYSELTFPKQSNTTQFHFVSGATGSGGTVTYNAPTQTITWFFTDDTVVTGSEIVLSYNSNIFSGVGCGFCRSDDLNSAALSSTQPAYIRADFAGHANRRATGNYVVQSSVSLTNNYNVTYTSVSSGTLANVFIDKSGAFVSSNISIKNSTAVKFAESSFNTANFSFSFLYDTGIALNMTDLVGDFDFVVVNSTNYTGPGVTPTPTPTPPPTGNSSSIITDKTTYSQYDFATVVWGVQDSVFNFLYNFNVLVQLPDGTSQTLFSSVDQTGSGVYQFINTGHYQFQLQQSTLLGFLVDTLATYDVNVETPHPYIYAPGIVLANQQFNVTYSYDRQPLSALENGFIDVFNMNSGVHESTRVTTIDTNNNTISNFTLPAVARYRLCLGSAGFVTSTCANIQSVSGTLPPTLNVSVSMVNLSKTTYWYLDTLSGFYAIDNANYSRTDGGTLFWDIFNTDMGIESMYGNIGSQAENFSLLIKNDNVGYTWDGARVYLPSNFFTGNNQFRIFAKNSTTTVHIVNGAFVLSSTNDEGWGLHLSKYSVLTNEEFQIYVTAPRSGNLSIVPATSGSRIITIPGSITLTETISQPGIAHIDLLNSTGYIQQSAIVNVTAAATPTPTPISSQTASSITTLLTSNIFWALIFILGLMLAVAVHERKVP